MRWQRKRQTKQITSTVYIYIITILSPTKKKINNESFIAVTKIRVSILSKLIKKKNKL